MEEIGRQLQSGGRTEVRRQREDGGKRLECSAGNEMFSITQLNMEKERTPEK